MHNTPTDAAVESVKCRRHRSRGVGFSRELNDDAYMEEKGKNALRLERVGERSSNTACGIDVTVCAAECLEVPRRQI
jgi:hypothetical protein